MALYALFILASSVALGWHYAIDGYAAAIIVCAVYFAVKATSACMEAAKTCGAPAVALKAS
jgi:hypothetical protein